jgi:hypothetical protein
MSRHNMNIPKGLFLLAVVSTAALGCELIVDFDRTKIPVEQTEAGPTDGSVVDTGTDTGVDATVPDASDAGSDASDASDAADAEDASDASDAD